jgi:hypothetical protein
MSNASHPLRAEREDHILRGADKVLYEDKQARKQGTALGRISAGPSPKLLSFRIT